MKKILVSMFLLVFGLFLVGCINNDSFGFVKPSVLRKSGLSDLIEPSHTDTYKREDLGYCYFNSTQDEFEKYAEELYDYLLKKDFPYFGYSGEILNSLFGANGTYELIPSSKLSDHYEEHFYYEKLDTISYEFVFGEELGSSNKVVSDVLVDISFKVDGNFDNGYNTSLAVRNNSNLMTSFIYIPQNIEYYEIEDAFNSGLLNKEDLQDIADVLNGITPPEYTYNRGYEIALQKKHLETLINTVSHANIKDIDVSFYFQNETGYVIRTKDWYTDYPAVEKEIIIDDIVLTYSGPKPIFVKIINEWYYG